MLNGRVPTRNRKVEGVEADACFYGHSGENDRAGEAVVADVKNGKKVFQPLPFSS